MKRNKKYEKWGFRFIINHATREIHHVKGLSKRCSIFAIKNGGYCTGIWAYILIKLFRYDGCAFCFKQFHKK